MLEYSKYQVVMFPLIAYSVSPTWLLFVLCLAHPFFLNDYVGNGFHSVESLLLPPRLTGCPFTHLCSYSAPFLPP